MTPPTWRALAARARRAIEGTAIHAYRCPVHGLVDVRVPWSEVPNEVACPRGDNTDPEGLLGHGGDALDWCGRPATWAGMERKS